MTTDNNFTESPKAKNSSRINYTTIINMVLFAGLVILYGLYFMKLNDVVDEVPQDQITGLNEKIESSTSNIAYVHSENLMENYLLAAKMRDEFEAEQKRLENDLSRRQRDFQAEVEKFQNEVTAGRLGMERAQQKEQELMQAQQELMQLNETYSTRLNRKEIEMNDELFETISSFLQEYNAEKGYDFILSYSRGGNLLFANQENDITEEIIELINAEFSAGNATVE